jgi:hypothetical protein
MECVKERAMTVMADSTESRPGNPLDLLEELVSANNWTFDRASDVELAVQIAGKWADYHIWSVWHADLRAMYFACHFDCRVPDGKRAEVLDLMAMFNENMWLGHFDYSHQEGGVLFRHTVPLRGTQGASVEQLEDLMDTAVTECERFYPALQLVVWAGQPSSQAMAVATLEPQGTA